MPGLPPPPAPDSDEEDESRAIVVAPTGVRPSPGKSRSGGGAKVAPSAGRDFSVQPEELCTFMEKAVGNKGSVETLERDFNGIMGLAHTLRVNPALGLVRSPRRCSSRCAPLHPLQLTRRLLRRRRCCNRRASRTSSRGTTTLAATCTRK